MGWFDGSSSSEDEGEGNKNQQSKSTTTTTQTKPADDDDDDDDDDEDPLDAYMNSLQQQQQQSSQSQQGQAKASRLDVENEEEATSHWEAGVSTSSRQSGTQNDDDFEFPSRAKTQAKEALSQTFHKAGDNKRGANRNVDIQLEQVSHASIEYAPMQRQFLTPCASSSTADTQQGHEWRQNHSVTCHPSRDPLFHWEELKDVFGSSVMEWIHKHQYTQPTLVQAQTVPVALSGADAIVTASTGEFIFSQTRHNGHFMCLAYAGIIHK